jgi:hypothetical protein
MEREATFSKKFHQLEYWDSRNTKGFVYCDSKEKAKIIIRNSGIEQTLRVR